MPFPEPKCVRCGTEQGLMLINGVNSVCSGCYKLLKLGDGVNVMFGAFASTRRPFEEEIRAWREKRRLESEEYKKMRENIKKGKKNEKASTKT